jgi:hypothetical protein
VSSGAWEFWFGIFDSRLGVVVGVSVDFASKMDGWMVMQVRCCRTHICIRKDSTSHIKPFTMHSALLPLLPCSSVSLIKK